MSKPTIEVQIQHCSNCKQHSWFTRHVESEYHDLAVEISNAVISRVENVHVQIKLAGPNKIGAFQILCNGRNIFSKIKLGYFPNFDSIMDKIVRYISELRNQKNWKYSSRGGCFTPSKKQNKDLEQMSKSQGQISRSVHIKSTPRLGNKSRHLETETNKRLRVQQQIKKRRKQLVQEFRDKYPNYQINLGVSSFKTSNNLNQNKATELNPQKRPYEQQTKASSPKRRVKYIESEEYKKAKNPNYVPEKTQGFGQASRMEQKIINKVIQSAPKTEHSKAQGLKQKKQQI